MPTSSGQPITGLTRIKPQNSSSIGVAKDARPIEIAKAQVFHYWNNQDPLTLTQTLVGTTGAISAQGLKFLTNRVRYVTWKVNGAGTNTGGLRLKLWNGTPAALGSLVATFPDTTLAQYNAQNLNNTTYKCISWDYGSDIAVVAGADYTLTVEQAGTVSGNWQMAADGTTTAQANQDVYDGGDIYHGASYAALVFGGSNFTGTTYNHLDGEILMATGGGGLLAPNIVVTSSFGGDASIDYDLLATGLKYRTETGRWGQDYGSPTSAAPLVLADGTWEYSYDGATIWQYDPLNTERHRLASGLSGPTNAARGRIRNDGSLVVIARKTIQETVGGSTYSRCNVVVTNAAKTSITVYDVWNGTTTLTNGEAHVHLPIDLEYDPVNGLTHLFFSIDNKITHRVLTDGGTWGSFDTVGFATYPSSSGGNTPAVLDKDGNCRIAFCNSTSFPGSSPWLLVSFPPDTTTTSPTSTVTIPHPTATGSPNWAGLVPDLVNGGLYYFFTTNSTGLALMDGIRVYRLKSDNTTWEDGGAWKANTGVANTFKEIHPRWISSQGAVAVIYGLATTGYFWFDWFNPSEWFVIARPYAWGYVLG